MDCGDNILYRFIPYLFVMWGIFITFVDTFDYNNHGASTNIGVVEEEVTDNILKQIKT